MPRTSDPVTTPPAHLSVASASWWRSVYAEYEMASHDLKLLTLAAEASDRAESARLILDAEGVVIVDRFGQPKKHPAVGIESEARAAFARLLRQLDLDNEPPPPPRNQWRPKRSRGRA